MKSSNIEKAMPKGQRSVPYNLIAWINENLNKHEYGKCVVELTIHQGHVKVRRSFEETVDLSALFAQKGSEYLCNTNGENE